MAIYHLSVKSISRSSGRSATAAAAYRAGERIHDLQTGEVFDYRRKHGVEHREIVLSQDAQELGIRWARNRQQLWNAAEQAEKRKDARIAREYEVALPAELSPRQRRALTRAFAHELADRYQCAVDIAIHRPHREGDQRNHHAHLLATTRCVTPEGLGVKTEVEWSNADRRRHGLRSASDEMTHIRSRWAALANEKLLEQGYERQIDHRTLKAQGIDREPTRHHGPEITAIERREKRSHVLEHEREEINRRLAEAHELGELEREHQWVQRSILDLSNDLRNTLRARERELSRGHDLEEGRRQAREAWLAYRERESKGIEHPKETEHEQERELDRGHGLGDD
jgi:ATP-dependent exoDNAse (exonuclease V) alpha subunit